MVGIAFFAVFWSGIVECRGMYVSLSFSAIYSLIELSEMGKFSGKVGFLLEPFVYSLGGSDVGFSLCASAF